MGTVFFFAFQRRRYPLDIALMDSGLGLLKIPLWIIAAFVLKNGELPLRHKALRDRSRRIYPSTDRH